MRVGAVGIIAALALAGCGASTALTALTAQSAPATAPPATPAVRVPTPVAAVSTVRARPASAPERVPRAVSAVLAHPKSSTPAGGRASTNAATCADVSVIEGMLAGGDTPAARAKGRAELSAVLRDAGSATASVRVDAQALVAAAEHRDELGALRALGALADACR